jgi:hypothetical protein
MSSSDHHAGGEGAEQRCEVLDITSLVEKAASSLTHEDPILRDAATFSLQQSMSALEVTDAKMDCCELLIAGASDVDIQSGRTVPPRKLPTGLRHPLVSSTLPWDDLTLSDACIIAHEALTRLYAVLDGAGAAESTYSYLYAHDGVLADMATELLAATTDSSDANAALSSVQAAKHAVYASALLLVKLNDSIRTIAMTADIYEEEDFTLNTQGFLFAPRVDLVAVANAVNLAIDTLRRVPNNAPDKDDAKALVLILQFQLTLFDICATMSSLKAESVRSRVKDVKSDLLVKCLKRGKELFALMQQAGANTGTPDEDNGGIRSKRMIDAAFDPYLCRALMGNTPVRKIRFKSTADALSGLLDIVAEMDWAVCDLLLEGSTLGRIKRMLAHVSKSSANILNRSLIVLNLYFDDLILGQHDIKALVIEHMRQLGGVPKAITETQQCQAFAVRLSKPIYDNLKLYALNRNRQHVYMDVLVIKEWPLLQEEAVSLDYYFHQELNLGEMDQMSAYLTNYTASLTSAIMAHYLSLQVELGLLWDHHDLAIAFWYRAFVLSAQLSAATLMRKAKVHQKVLAARAAALEVEANKASSESKAAGNVRSKKKGKKGTGNSKRAQTSATMDAPKESKEDTEDGVELMLTNLKRTLCRGIVQFIAALDQAGLVETPNYEFTSQRKRFSKRYEAFASISTPPPLTYGDFEQGYSHAEVSQQTLIASAIDCFKASKTVVDKLLLDIGDDEDCYLPIRRNELKSLAKVCIANSLFLHKFLSQVQSGEKVEGTVSFDFEAHGAFCIVKLA